MKFLSKDDKYLIKKSSKCKSGEYLERGWIIANHKLVSFHAAFISSVLSLSGDVEGKLETLKFMFLSGEAIISAIILYLSWHIGIAVHEMGHYITAARLTALNKSSQEIADFMQNKGFFAKLWWYAKIFIQIPWGRFNGIKKEGGNFFPDAPYNLAVAAAGPVWSSTIGFIALALGTIFIILGLGSGSEGAIYVGRFLLAPGIVGILDRYLADRGKVKEFKTREKKAREDAARASKGVTTRSALLDQITNVKKNLINTRIQTVAMTEEMKVSAPWQYRNCAMGGRHTEKEYPESNISMQEGMFVPLSAETYEEAQEMTVRLQTRLKEILESTEGCRIMGIGLEGGLAPYVIKEESDLVPEQRMWRLMKQAILDCGYRPLIDVAIALDPASSELENAYRKELDRPSSVGMYLFWRDKNKVVMSREKILALYKTVIEKDAVPIITIEDGFGERDHEGWKLIMEELGDKMLIVGDDLVTTKDSNIEECAREGLINSTLIKANQIGTLSETVLAMLTSLAYGAQLVISHRSKSPIDSFEADLAIALQAVGMKAGGGANTERLQKYGRVMEIIALIQDSQKRSVGAGQKKVEEKLHEIVISSIRGKEEATNAGIPSASANVFLGKTGTLRFKGSTPLGTSAGEDEAIHYIDSTILPNKVTNQYPDLFKGVEDGTYRFVNNIKIEDIEGKEDEELLALWKKAGRYDGMGCMDAARHIETVLSRSFIGKTLGEIGNLVDIDRELLRLEKEEAITLGWLAKDAPYEEQVHVMQRKGVLGANAILSMSLALGRAVAARDGKELWQIIREQAVEVMTKFIVAHGHVREKGWEILKAVDLNELIKEFKDTAKEAIGEGKPIYKLLRDQFPIYSESTF